MPTELLEKTPLLHTCHSQYQVIPLHSYKDANHQRKC